MERVPWSPPSPSDGLPDLLFGGYRLVLPVARPAAFEGMGLPESFLTASPCIGTVIPFAKLLPNSERSSEEVLNLRRVACMETGFAEEVIKALESVVAGLLDSGELLWGDVLTTPRSAEALLAVLPRDRPWRLLGLGLPRRLREEFLAWNGTSGIDRLLECGLDLPSDGRPLGWEPLGFEWGGWPHSWLCNGLPGSWGREAGIETGDTGLLTRVQAERCAEWCNRDEAQAEPVYWAPWLLLDFTGALGKSGGGGRTAV